MFYLFPFPTRAIARLTYERPYPAAIAARAGEIVVPVTDNPPETDFMGWTWCREADGREGWVPDAWCVASQPYSRWTQPVWSWIVQTCSCAGCCSSHERD